ncbi:MAG: radical SAM protein, partial [Ruminiclostridium sp.]|nr:radical SAM protein [Ruminiclostridium sp.]
VKLSENGLIEKGLIIRHMVLPSHRHDSMRVLELIKENLPVDKIKISLLRQYTPCNKALTMKNLSRRVTTFEYNSVADYAEKLGFDGYLQEKSSATLEMTPDWDLEGV